MSGRTLEKKLVVLVNVLITFKYNYTDILDSPLVTNSLKTDYSTINLGHSVITTSRYTLNRPTSAVLTTL